MKFKKETNYAGVSRCGARVEAYRLQEGLGLVKAIKLFVLHHQEMSSIYDYSFQADEGAQQSRTKKSHAFSQNLKLAQCRKQAFLNPQILTCYRSQ